MARPVSLALRARSCGYAWLLLAWCAACELDPVAKHSLCKGDGPISANCQECQQPPYAAGCPQCIADPNSTDCQMASTETNRVSGGGGDDVAIGTGPSNGGNSPTNPGQQNQSGASGKNGPSDSSVPNSSNPSGSGGPAGGAQPAGSGNGSPTGGAAADGGMITPPPPPGTCTKDEDCGGDTPGCNLNSSHCVPCTKNEHCRDGKVCDAVAALCVECNASGGCGADMVCDLQQQHCFQCLSDTNCTQDPVNSTCSRLRQCVDCEDNRGCSAPTPVCNGNTCVQCTGDSNCSGTDHRCSPDNRCVECLVRDNDCVDTNKPVCIVDEQRCVQCMAPTDCHDPAAARCNSNNTCAGCNADSDCAHLTDTPVCDTSAHRCVQCNTVNQCGANACVPSTHSCSDVRKRSLDTCSSCQSDEQCISGDCVPMTFSNLDIGSFCLNPEELVASQKCSANRPYSRRLVDQKTIDGATATVCGPPDSTTCKAVLDATNSKSCSSASQCGVGMGLIDSTCLTSGRCSYVCATSTDCPLSLSACGQGNQCALPGN